MKDLTPVCVLLPRKRGIGMRRERSATGLYRNIYAIFEGFLAEEALECYGKGCRGVIKKDLTSFCVTPTFSGVYIHFFAIKPSVSAAICEKP